MGQEVGFSCSCGTVKGRLVDISPRAGTRALCHCSQCRAAELYLGQHDPRPKGVELFQTAPNQFRIDEGAEQLAIFTLPNTKLLRWYATCCNAPMFNVINAPKMNFGSLILARVENADVLGPVVCEGFLPAPDGKQRHKGLSTMMLRIFARALSGLWSGSWRDTPFFDPDTRKPARDVKRLTKDDLPAEA